MKERMKVFAVVSFVVILAACGRDGKSTPLPIPPTSPTPPPGGGTTFTITSSASLPRAKQSEAYGFIFQTQNGREPIIWSVAEGELPPGLRLSGNSIEGVSQAYGQFEFVVKALDADSEEATKRFTLICACGDLYQLADPHTRLPVEAYVRVLTRPACGSTIRVNTIPQMRLELYQTAWDTAQFTVLISQDGERPVSPRDDPAINHPWYMLGGVVSRDQRLTTDFGRLFAPGISASSKPRLASLAVWISKTAAPGQSSGVWFGPQDCRGSAPGSCNWGQGMIILDLNVVD